MAGPGMNSVYATPAWTSPRNRSPAARWSGWLAWIIFSALRGRSGWTKMRRPQIDPTPPDQGGQARPAQPRGGAIAGKNEYGNWPGVAREGAFRRVRAGFLNR